MSARGTPHTIRIKIVSAELEKGNNMHINGMTNLSTLLGVYVVRPLLAVRKSDLVDFAERARVCYMQDSTLKWSRRG